jgi:phosphoenolpyruvate phosphomutase
MPASANPLRQLLREDRPILAAGAHNALSAKLVERAGFDAVWASGFEISASYAIPDANLLTMTENLEVAKAMADAVRIPVIADCDNGYGNAVNVVRTVEEYEKAGIAAICIEDNVFPKRCSFYAGVKRELAEVEEHAGKIRAAKDAQRSDDFFVIARTEALIAGWGMEEALKRATAYAEAGADAILIHSKARTPDELWEFARHWTLDTPLVSVPTIYKDVTAEELYRHGYKVVIFANHTIRSAIRAMRDTLEVLRREKRPAAVDDRIVDLDEVYELVGVKTLNEQERQYLPAGTRNVTAIIVAAGVDRELLPLTADIPKAMLDIKGKTILERQVETLNECNIKDIVVVRGYKKEKINLPNIRYYDNDRFELNYELASLFRAEREIAGRFVFLYSDILFDRSILEKLLQSPDDITIVVDRAFYDQHVRLGVPPARKLDLVQLASPPTQGYRFMPADTGQRVVHIGQKIGWQEAHGEFIGMAMCSERGAEILRRTYHKVIDRYNGRPFQEAESVEKASFTDLIQEIIDDGQPVAAVDIYKGWMDIDTFDDYRRAWAEIRR